MDEEIILRDIFEDIDVYFCFSSEESKVFVCEEGWKINISNIEGNKVKFKDKFRITFLCIKHKKEWLVAAMEGNAEII